MYFVKCLQLLFITSIVSFIGTDAQKKYFKWTSGQVFLTHLQQLHFKKVNCVTIII